MAFGLWPSHAFDNASAFSYVEPPFAEGYAPSRGGALVNLSKTHLLKLAQIAAHRVPACHKADAVETVTQERGIACKRRETHECAQYRQEPVLAMNGF